MFPPVLEPLEKFINIDAASPEKKIYKKAPRLKWNPNFEMISIEPPVKLEPKYKKAYKIRFKYRNNIDGKICAKTVLFGGNSEFVDTANEKIRTLKHTRLSHQQDPFHPNYWTLQILNSYPTVEQSYTHIIQKLVNLKK